VDIVNRLAEGRKFSEGLASYRTVTPPSALSTAAAEPRQGTVRVLVVDDQVLYAEAISVLLGMQAGIEVVGIAADGQEAIAQATDLRPDLVLMDIEMPRLDGISATRWIRRRLPETKVVVMTALTGEEYATRALKAGAEACVQKFSHSGDLLETIENVV
jgi:DNA-binding NarL/FixJ family response regulator